MTNVNFRRQAFKAALNNAGIDTNKDYFSLSLSEIAIVEKVRKSFNYSGDNYLGRSKSRQFYYSAQKAK